MGASENTRSDAVRICMKRFMQLPIEEVDLSSDKSIAANAALMEKVCLQYDAIIHLVGGMGSAYDDLTPKFQEEFEEKIGKAAGLVNYYRLQRQVITNQYYRTHETAEIGKKSSVHDTEEQKNLTILLKQAKGGLEALKQRGTDFLDTEQKALVSDLLRGTASESALEMQKKLADRRAEIEKKSFSGYLDQLAGETLADGVTLKKQPALEHAKKLQGLALSDSPEEAFQSLPAIMDQLALARNIHSLRQNSPGNFMLEQSTKDQEIAKEVENLMTCLQTMEIALLRLGRLTEGGKLDLSHLSEDDKAAMQAAYKESLTDYRARTEKIRALQEAKTKTFPDFEKVLSPEQAAKKRLAEEAGKEQPNPVPLQKAFDDLMLKLSGAEFTNYSLYTNREEIAYILQKYNQELNPEQKAALELLNNAATSVWAGQQLLDAEEAGQKTGITPEEEQKVKDRKDALKDLVRLLDEKSESRLQALRVDAQRSKFDSADLKAEAKYYLFQEEWAKNGLRTTMSKETAKSHAYYKKTQFASWLFANTRNKNHGVKLYKSSKKNLKLMPEGMKTLGDGNLQKFDGDGKVAPPVDLIKYFNDPMKMRLVGKYKALRAVLDTVDQTKYPAPLLKAVEALECYSNVRGVVTQETFEMETAFLDQYRISIEAALKAAPVIFDDPVYKHILDITSDLQECTNGNLRKQMSPEEFEAAKELPAVYTTKNLYFDSAESNMKNLPLFPHEPQLNDVKQGLLGNCYMHAAVQAVVLENPNAIRDMFYDLGDGNVLVRFFAPFGVVKDEKTGQSYRRIDESRLVENATFRPVYVKVKKHYETGEGGANDCMWMQLLEKAYAAAGFNHNFATIKKDGELEGFQSELTLGDKADVMMHLTGKKYEQVNVVSTDALRKKPRTFQQNDRAYSLRNLYLLRNIPPHLHEEILTALEQVRKNAVVDEKDPNREETLLRGILNQILTDRKNRAKEKLDEAFSARAKSDAPLTEAEIKELRDGFSRIYDFDPEAYTKQILDNLDNTEDPGEEDLIGASGFTETLDAFAKGIAEQKQPMNELKTILSQTKNWSQEKKKEGKAGGLFEEEPEEQEQKKEKPVDLFGEDEEEQVEKKEKPVDLFGGVLDEKASKEKAQKREKEKKESICAMRSVFEYDPGSRYNVDALGFLGTVRRCLAKGQILPISLASHDLTVIDVKMNDGKWFLLIRDPFNVYGKHYKKGAHNEVQTTSFGFREALFLHGTVRSLEKSNKNETFGFLGTTWWELGDAFKEITSIARPISKKENA